MVTHILKEILPHEGGAVELRNVGKSYDCYHVPLYYWFYFSAADLESLPVNENLETC
jgi:hypothetical protein